MNIALLGCIQRFTQFIGPNRKRTQKTIALLTTVHLDFLPFDDNGEIKGSMRKGAQKEDET